MKALCSLICIPGTLSFEFSNTMQECDEDAFHKYYGSKDNNLNS